MESSNQDANIYELEKVRFIVKDAVQLDIDYAYDDLIFSEYGVFIIQFDKNDDNCLMCWFNKECLGSDRTALFESLKITSELNGFRIVDKGTFEMEPNESGEEINIKFCEV